MHEVLSLNLSIKYLAMEVHAYQSSQPRRCTLSIISNQEVEAEESGQWHPGVFCKFKAYMRSYRKKAKKKKGEEGKRKGRKEETWLGGEGHFLLLQWV